MKRVLAILLALASSAAAAQSNVVVRLRGSIESFTPPEMVLKERGGETFTLLVPEQALPVEVIPTDISMIQPGSFIGTAAMPKPDGKLEALEVVVFPEAARGAGEGHFPWDLKADSTMTNATVATLVRSGNGRTLTLRYRDGEKTVVVPEGIPIVTFRQGERSLIARGSKAFVIAEPVEDNKFAVKRLLIGKNGMQPPM